jgi:hypothetical protein
MRWNRVSGWLRMLPSACAAATIGACGAGSDVWEGTISDSAGVAVVTNPEAGLWQAGDGWVVREELAIGEVEGDPDYLFGSIAGVCVSSRGDVLVVDRQAATVRVFDPDGVLVGTLGGPGSGPGELSNTLSGCYVGPGDTVAVPDLQLNRVTRYALDGGVVESVPFDIGDGIPIRWSMLPDGRLVAQVRFGLLDPSQLGVPDALVAAAPDGALEDRILELPASDVIGLRSGRPRYTLLAPQPIWTLGDDGSVWVTDGRDYRIVRYEPTGAPTRIVSRTIAAQPVSDLDRTAIATGVERTFPAPLITSVLGGINVAPTFPFVFALAVGPEGTLWAQRFRPPGSAGQGMRDAMEFGPRDAEVFLADVNLRLGAPEWDVFDAEGRYLGIVALPEGFEAFQFAGDAIYGVWRDPMQVEYVKRLRVVPSERD